MGAERPCAVAAEDGAARRGRPLAGAAPPGPTHRRRPGSAPTAGTFAGLDSAQLGRRLAARHGRRRRARPLHPGGQHLDRDLQQDRRRTLAAFTFNTLWSARAPERCATPTTAATRRSSTTRSATAGSSPTSPSPASGSAPPFYECIAVSQTGDPGQRRLVLLRDPRRRRGPSLVPRLPEDGHLAGRALHDRQHVRTGRHASRRCAAGRSTATTWSPARRCGTVVVDLEHRRRYFSLLPSNMRTARRAAGRARRTSSSPSRRPRSRFAGLQVPRRLLRQRLDLHRPDERQPDDATRSPRRPCRRPANALDTLRERLMMQAQYRTSAAPSRCG